MSERGTVKVQPLTFGTSGTSTVVLSSSTSTSNPIPMPRDDFTVQLDVVTTGTSIGSGTCVWQGSNDGGVGWFPLGTLTGLSTNASTASSVAVAGTAITSKFALGRGIVSGTGTSQITAFVGS